jgi:hypothetical protein
MDAELEQFKSDIDLRVLAGTFGYQLDRKDSWAGSAVMRGPNNEKIAIKRDADGHWIYYSFRDDDNNGTAIDFVRRQLGVASLGHVRLKLREFMGQPPAMLVPYPPLLRVGKDRIRVERAFARMPIARSNDYLENERRIPRRVLESRRIAGRIRVNSFGSAVFPHFDAEGLSGFEIKGPGYTSFSKGGTKAIWTSHAQHDDNRIAFFESAIDGLSFIALFPDERTRLASLAGRPTPLQKELVRAAIAVMPASATVLAAMDADQAGRDMANVIREAVQLTGRSDLRFEVREPQGYKDWNELLQRQARLTRRNLSAAEPA